MSNRLIRGGLLLDPCSCRKVTAIITVLLRTITKSTNVLPESVSRFLHGLYCFHAIIIIIINILTWPK